MDLSDRGTGEGAEERVRGPEGFGRVGFSKVFDDGEGVCDGVGGGEGGHGEDGD